MRQYIPPRRAVFIGVPHAHAPVRTAPYKGVPQFDMAQLSAAQPQGPPVPYNAGLPVYASASKPFRPAGVVPVGHCPYAASSEPSVPVPLLATPGLAPYEGEHDPKVPLPLCPRAMRIGGSP